jgi:hypothetical protein
MKTEKTFLKKYTPLFNEVLVKEGMTQLEKENVAPFAGCLYETYGEELKFVFNKAKTNYFKNVWTIIHSDGRSNALYVVAGWHLVNRVGYILTKENWSRETEEYKF